MANFINAELWGRPTDVPWAMVFPGAGPEPRHPSQLYEAALEGVLLFLVLRLLSHRFELLKKPGFLAGAFAFGYGIGRSIAEFYRVPDAHIGYLSGFSDDGDPALAADDPGRARSHDLGRTPRIGECCGLTDLKEKIRAAIANEGSDGRSRSTWPSALETRNWVTTERGNLLAVKATL